MTRSLRQSWSWMVCVLAMLLAPSGRGENPAATDQADIQGRWKIVSLTVGGMPVDFDGGDNTLLIDGRKMTFPELKSRNLKAETVWILLDPTAKPRSVDILPKGVDPDTPQPKDSHTVGIYELEGDSLKICWVLAGDRPAAFESTPKTSLLVAKRLEKGAARDPGRTSPQPAPPKP